MNSLEDGIVHSVMSVLTDQMSGMNVGAPVGGQSNNKHPDNPRGYGLQMRPSPFKPPIRLATGTSHARPLPDIPRKTFSDSSMTKHPDGLSMGGHGRHVPNSMIFDDVVEEYLTGNQKHAGSSSMKRPSSGPLLPGRIGWPQPQKQSSGMFSSLVTGPTTHKNKNNNSPRDVAAIHSAHGVHHRRSGGDYRMVLADEEDERVREEYRRMSNGLKSSSTPNAQMAEIQRRAGVVTDYERAERAAAESVRTLIGTAKSARHGSSFTGHASRASGGLGSSSRLYDAGARYPNSGLPGTRDMAHYEIDPDYSINREIEAQKQRKHERRVEVEEMLNRSAPADDRRKKPSHRQTNDRVSKEVLDLFHPSIHDSAPLPPNLSHMARCTRCHEWRPIDDNTEDKVAADEHFKCSDVGYNCYEKIKADMRPAPTRPLSLRSTQQPLRTVPHDRETKGGTPMQDTREHTSRSDSKGVDYEDAAGWQDILDDLRSDIKKSRRPSLYYDPEAKD